MEKIGIKVDKSLAGSLNLISNLLTKSLSVSTSHIVLANEDYDNTSKHEETSARNTHLKTLIKSEFLDTEEPTSSNKHPFKGLDSNIKSFTIAPIVSSTGSKLGHLALLDIKERTLTIDEKSLLTDFAHIIAATLEKHLENQQLYLVFTDLIHKTIHDLKNPLTSISLTTELLKRKADDPKMVGNFSEKIDKANKRLFSNLEDLKSAFPIDERSFKLNNTEINLGELLENIKTETHNIEADIKKSTEINVFGDYNRLKEATKKLINHIGSTAIEIKLYTKDNTAIIEINSNGTITDTTTTALAISRTLIQMHKGKIEIKENGYAIYLPFDVS